MKMLPIRAIEAELEFTAYKNLLGDMSLGQLVTELFTYLDYTEETDSGREFHPVVISSCRAMVSQPLDAVLKTLREKSHE